jgi:hypothetical protein
MRNGYRALLAALLVTGALVGGIGTAAADSRTAIVTGEATSLEWCVVPNVMYMHVLDAAAAIEEADCGDADPGPPACHLEWNYAEPPGENDVFVARQSPLGGFLLQCGDTVSLTMDTGCVVPSVRGLPLQIAYDRLAAARLRSTTTGQGKIVDSQYPFADRRVPCHSVVNLKLRRGRIE